MKQTVIRILGVIGDPISHSLSPLMHNAALAALHLPYVYYPFRVKVGELGRFFNNIRKRPVVGLNVTLPHKEAVIPFMDSLSPQATLIGAVNSIVIGEGRMVGHNTDASGYVTSLKREASFSVRGKDVILIGAGGAARSIGVAMGMGGARWVHIFNRTLLRAENLRDSLMQLFSSTKFTASSLKEALTRDLSTSDLLINTTSVGVSTKANLNFPLKRLSRRALISDVVYSPLETPLLKRAKILGMKVHPGWGMLLYQGAESFRLFTGHRAPIPFMRQVLIDELVG